VITHKLFRTKKEKKGNVIKVTLYEYDKEEPAFGGSFEYQPLRRRNPFIFDFKFQPYVHFTKRDGTHVKRDIEGIETKCGY